MLPPGSIVPQMLLRPLRSRLRAERGPLPFALLVVPLALASPQQKFLVLLMMAVIFCAKAYHGCIIYAQLPFSCELIFGHSSTRNPDGDLVMTCVEDRFAWIRRRLLACDFSFCLFGKSSGCGSQLVAEFFGCGRQAPEAVLAITVFECGGTFVDVGLAPSQEPVNKSS